MRDIMSILKYLNVMQCFEFGGLYVNATHKTRQARKDELGLCVEKSCAGTGSSIST